MINLFFDFSALIAGIAFSHVRGNDVYFQARYQCVITDLFSD